MKHFFKIISTTLFIAFTSCNSPLPDIPIEKVKIDTTTNIYTYRDTNKKVTGNLISKDNFNDIPVKVVEKVIDGRRLSCFAYYPNGNKYNEYYCDDKGRIRDEIIWYHENGQVDEKRPYIDGKANGTAIRYDEDGKKILEQIYKNNRLIKEYNFDKNGNRIISASENLELVKIETGFYRYTDFNSGQILFLPTVLSKWKNKSDNPISENMDFEAIFIDNNKNEELAADNEYFQGISDIPLEPNLSRQIKLQSSVGITNDFAINNSNISCKITIDGMPYKTIKIQNKMLYSTRIQ
ncbi:MAG: hypothetical protein BGO86_15570 [Chryseobacterium sp. 36-9]|nr:MAG: hypothetical protein BGO86_15570 [Chryseobacterium sp. 36-9]